MWFFRSYCSLLFPFRQARSIADGVDLAKSSQHPSISSLLFISVSVNTKQMKVMIDTGAQCSFINAQCLQLTDQSNFSNIKHQYFYMADGLTSFVVTGTVHLNILIGGYVTTISAYITKNLCANLILGMDYLTKYDLDIQPKKKMIIFNFDNEQVTVPFDFESNSIVGFARVLPPRLRIEANESTTISNSFHPLDTRLNTIIPSSLLPTLESTIFNLITHVTDPTQYASIQSLLSKFTSQFDTSKYTVARTTISHAIETYPHTPPVSKSFQNSPTMIAEMRLIIDNLLNAGLIRPSQSSYAAPALLVKKKDQTWRLVIDYKKLNLVTIPDCYPLPNIEITLQTLGTGYTYFSKLDLKSGFWQLPIAAKDCFKTAFITPFGLFEWLVLPQGLRNSPPSFQRIMNNILGTFSDFCLVYLDDIVIFSRDFDEHLRHLNKVLHALREHNLILHPNKCEIAKQTIEYLGHLISSTSIKPLPDKIKSILSLPEPRTLAQANRFIGSLSWYRKFIPGFSSIAAPIHAITNLSKSHRYKFKWGLEQSQSFADLKRLITSTPLFLNFPDDSYPVLLSTDASKVGVGGILYQEINNEKRVLYYHSELLSSTQKRYHPIELEALAIFKCINRMKYFLLGRNIIIYTDNCPLCHMMNKKISNKRVDKISILLQEFNIQQIIHVQGKYNCLPDYLSRNPISNDDELLDYDYGLGFSQAKPDSPIRLLGGVVTRSKSKALALPADPSSSSSLTTSSSSLVPSAAASTDRSPLALKIEPFDITKLKEQQSNDPHVQQIIHDLSKRPNISFDYQDGILYKLLPIAHARTKRKLIYVPAHMIPSLLLSYHDNPLIGGHFAVTRTLDKIKQQYWWPDMKSSIINHIQSCLVCQAHNISRQKRPGFLQPIPSPDGPNQLIGIDFCGPFPPTPQENRYVLCLTDYFTKFVTAVALPTCTAAATAAVIFKEYICHYGVPKAIISDQGTSFKNQLMNSLSTLIGFNHILCTPYHPQSNGQTERFNSTFVTQIAKLTDRESNNWDEYLSPIIFAYNTGIHSTTNISPFELTFGRQANLPIDQPPTFFTFPSPHDYYQQLVRHLKLYHAAVKHNVFHRQQQTKRRYDRNRPNPRYDIGTTVLTRLFFNKSKLDPVFSTAPKIVIEQHHPVYWVKDINTNVVSRVHINDIRPIILPSPHS
jgi:hypothetical protein